MTTFFEQQDRAKRNTRWLVVLMGVAVLGLSAALYVVLIVFGFFGTESPRSEAMEWWNLEAALAAFFGTLAVVFGASMFRSFSLRSGGRAVAESLGARRIHPATRDPLERRLVNCVEEMAIASGIPVPHVYVLDEPGINAFAAGHDTSDAVVAVTRGSLEVLTRDELQGVVAHEFSHILNGDMRLNIRLIGIVFGILCIGLLGHILLRIGWLGSAGRGSKKNNTVPLIALGLALIVIGFIGRLVANIIKAGISRQREFLADASAVQFTRNRDGIAGALKKIGGWSEGSELSSSRAEEMSHLFFSDAIHHGFSAMLATHPPLTQRIKRLDPTFRGKFARVDASDVQLASAVSEFSQGAAASRTTSAFASGDAPSAGVAAGVAGGLEARRSTPASSRTSDTGRRSSMAEAVVGRVGQVEGISAEEARSMIDGIPDILREAATDAFSAEAVLYALLMSEQQAVFDKQMATLRSLQTPGHVDEISRLLPGLRAMSRRLRLPLVELCAPALRNLSATQRRVFAESIHQLIQADEQVSIFEFLLGYTLRKRMWEVQEKARSRGRLRSIRAMREEVTLLLSMLAHASGASGDAPVAGAVSSEAERAYAAGRQRLPDLQWIAPQPLASGPLLLSGLELALEKVATAEPILRGHIVDACAHVVLHDEVVTEAEEDLLRVICDALDAPMPPLPAGSF